VVVRQRLYSWLPPAAQSAAISIEGWQLRRERLGGDFAARLAEYLRRERASEDEWREVRARRLRRLLEHAARHLPYWRDLFRRTGLDPARVVGPDDLRVLPVMTKDTIRANRAGMIWHGAPARLVRTVHTSGTTGAGLVFPTTLDAIRDQYAVWWRYRSRFGLDPKTWAATFGGRTVVPKAAARPPFWRVNRVGRQVLYSQYHLGPATASAYLADLARRDLPWWHGYPSILALLASFVGPDARGPRARVITLGAENLLSVQRRAIQRAFGVDPIQHYGMAEGAANASQCPAGRMHVDEDYAAVELESECDGRVRILGTCLENLVLPFIRYDTGDLARVLPTPCECGLPGRALEAIDGRQEDLVILADGSRVGRLDHLFKDMENVAEAQIRQPEPGRCTIAIVPREGWGPADEALLLGECAERFGARLEVRIVLVDQLPRTGAGKLRLVVSDLSEGRLEPKA